MVDGEFYRLVKKFFRKRGWSTGASLHGDFFVERDIFKIEVLLGPELYDRRYPLVPGFLSDKLVALQPRSGIANVLIVVRDRTTLPFFNSLTSATPTTVIYWDDLSLIDGLCSALLLAANDPNQWAVLFTKKNFGLRKELAGLAPDARDGLIRWP